MIMSHIQYIDELIREYLLYRGFSNTLKAFDLELKADKDKGFRVDKIIDQLMQNVNTYDLVSLRDLWAHLDQKVFSKLEHNFAPAVKKLENAVLKMYLVNCVLNNKHDKMVDFFTKMTPELQNQAEWKEWFTKGWMQVRVSWGKRKTFPEIKKLENAVLKMYLVNCVLNNKHDKMVDFFTKMTPELQNQAEWKEWFMLPYIKNPEENPSFAVHFTRQWQDTMLASLHNFLSIIFQCMPQPTLSSFEEDAAKIKRLQEENDSLRIRLSVLLENPRSTTVNEVTAPSVDPPAELMDDFYIIAQEAPAAETQTKTLKNLIRNIGSNIGGTTKKLSSSSSTDDKKSKQRTSSSTSSGNIPQSSYLGSSSTQWSSKSGEHLSSKRTSQSPHSGGGSAASVEKSSSKRDPSVEAEKRTRPEVTKLDISSGANIGEKSSFLILSQDEYTEHRSSVTHCKFNASGSVIASSDVDGVIKVWSTTPVKTIATFVSKSSIMALDWVSKNERYFIHGNQIGLVRLYDTKEKKIIWELGADLTSQLKDTRVVNICCSPTESYFICSAAARPSSEQTGSSKSKLLLYDIKTKKLERLFSLSPSSLVINCCSFNHNGQLLVTGGNDGVVRIFDLRRMDCIDSWQAHHGEIYSIQLTADFTSCYTLGQDGKFCQRSVNQSGQILWEASLPESSILATLSTSAHPISYGQHFTFDQTGSHVLLCGPAGGMIYQMLPTGLNRVVGLGGHRSAVVTTDWASANECCTCITGSIDGKIKITTLLSQ